MPIALRISEKRGFDRAFVNGSANCLDVGTYLTSISLDCCCDLMKLYRTSMCLVLLWNLGSIISSMADMLSQYNGMDRVNFRVISMSSRRSQVHSLAASQAATNLASVVDNDTHFWRRLLQATGPPFSMKINPDVDRRV